MKHLESYKIFEINGNNFGNLGTQISITRPMTDIHKEIIPKLGNGEPLFPYINYKNIFKKQTWSKEFWDMKYVPHITDLYSIGLTTGHALDERSPKLTEKEENISNF